MRKIRVVVLTCILGMGLLSSCSSSHKRGVASSDNPPQSVLIEAKFIEISDTDLEELGIQHPLRDSEENTKA